MDMQKLEQPRGPRYKMDMQKLEQPRGPRYKMDMQKYNWLPVLELLV